MGLFSAVFGTYSQHQIRKLNHQVDEIEALSEKFAAMTDEELRGMTPLFRSRLEQGESLDDLLPEAFALVREADDRVLGKRPFRVQLLGGIVLHQGRIAEMKTGEGKTLVATLPAYLNALTGNGVHIVTVNEYLARCGYEEMGRVYGFLGLTTGLIFHGQTREEKQAAYRADITYGTNNEFGFDYLRDNMVVYKELLAQRSHNFAIVDEVDSILIDEARTPLIISGEGEASTSLYDDAERFAARLKQIRIKESDDKVLNDQADGDYIVDEKARTCVLTESGVRKAEEFFRIENLSDPENALLAHHINQALRAHGIMLRDDSYVVKDGKVLIVDTHTGRIMPGRRYSDGLHQAIEAKEHVDIEKETKTLASITFQNYFRLYRKLSGMTGTALTEEVEFREIYNLDVVEIPTNMPMIRTDLPDAVYRTKEGKYRAILAQIRECHAKGQPVLVGTASVEKSELLSALLSREGIHHTVLNAKYHEREAEIVAQAGRLGTVTIATNMAGRGTDILLGGNPEFMTKQELRRLGYDEGMIGNAVSCAFTEDPEILAARELYRDLFEKYKEAIRPEAAQVCAVGGLYILGTERHESRRIDNQLRGRSGRQGDPGMSRFFLSMEDDLMRLFGSERIAATVARLGLPEDQPISAGILSSSIRHAQKQLESRNFAGRKNVLNYDDVLNQQRKVIYGERRMVLDGSDLSDKIQKMIAHYVNELALTVFSPETEDEPTEQTFAALRGRLTGTLLREEDFTDPQTLPASEEELRSLLQERADALYRSKEELFGSETLREIERVLLLRNVDTKWMEHLDAMEEIKAGISLQAYAQRNPLDEYRIEGADLFDAMISDIQCETARGVLSVMPRSASTQRKEVAKVTGEGFEGEEKPQAKKPLRKTAKVGPNEPCPCGSGKKYKKCCGMRDD